MPQSSRVKCHLFVNYFLQLIYVFKSFLGFSWLFESCLVKGSHPSNKTGRGEVNRCSETDWVCFLGVVWGREEDDLCCKKWYQHCDGTNAVSNPSSLAKASSFSNLKLYPVAAHETSHVIFSFSSINQHNLWQMTLETKVPFSWSTKEIFSKVDTQNLLWINS